MDKKTESKKLLITCRQKMKELGFEYNNVSDLYFMPDSPDSGTFKFVINPSDELELVIKRNDGTITKLISSESDIKDITKNIKLLTNSKSAEVKMHVKNLRCRKIVLGKYSKVACKSDEVLTSDIELVPDSEVVAENPETVNLEAMDVVILPNGSEVVVLEDPKPEDETIKVQETDTKVIADLPVETFSKATKVNMKAMKAYSEEVPPKSDKPAETEEPVKIAATIEETENGFKVKISGADPVEVTDKESLFNSLASIMDAKGMKDPKLDANSKRPGSAFLNK